MTILLKTGYVQNGHPSEALILFQQMQLENILPDRATILAVVPACADILALQRGKIIHGHIIKGKFQSDVYVGNSLVTMYAKCGKPEISRKVFDNMPKRNVVSWNAMIAGYAQNGDFGEALTLFKQMKSADMIPDQVTILSALQACAALSALQEGF